MSRWGKPTKNKKRRDPRYFLNEEQDQLERNLEYIKKTNEKTKQTYAKIEKMEQEFEQKMSQQKDEFEKKMAQKDKEYAEEKERQQKILMKKRAKQAQQEAERDKQYNEKSLRNQQMANAGYNCLGLNQAISTFLEKKYTEFVVSQNWDKAVKFLKTKGDIFAKMEKMNNNTNWQDYNSVTNLQKQYLDLAKQLGVPYTLTKHFAFTKGDKDE